MTIFFQKVENVALALVKKYLPSRFELVAKNFIYFKYIFSGGVAALTDLVLLALFKEVFGIHYLISAILAFIIAFVVSFILQKYLTFMDHTNEKIHLQATIYFGVAVSNLALNTFLMYVFVDLFHIWYLLSQVFISGLIAIWSFIIYRKFIFKKKMIRPIL